MALSSLQAQMTIIFAYGILIEVSSLNLFWNLIRQQ